jgi:PQQ-dependent dehydrogenase (methanol/ethanol family)
VRFPVRNKRLAIVLVLVAGGVLVGLLASGVLSRSTNGNGAQIPTTAPLATTSATTPSSLPAEASSFGPGDWGMYGDTPDEIRHSPLTEITKQNVNTLGRLADIDFHQLDKTVPNGQQSFPIVVNGVIYVTTSDDYVFAIDGGSGKEIWEWKPSNTGVFANYGVNANRGVAYCDGKVFLLTLDMNIVSLDATNGKLVKEVAISDTVPGASAQFSYSETQAPICYDGTLIIGASGSDYGVRGFVMAYTTDLEPAWPSPYWIIPPDGTEWRSYGVYTGGGTNWNPATIDPETNTVYITTSNPSPIFVPQVRPGPDPRTDSLIALDLSTGQQRWWQQQIPGDQWGYSTSQPSLVYNIKIGGRERRVVSVATKEGTWWMYDARTGAPIFTHVQLLNQLEHPALVPGKPVQVYPSSLGGLNYSPSSFDPTTGYVINSQAETSVILQQKASPQTVNKYKVKGDVDNGLVGSTFGYRPKDWHDYGSITAVNAAIGKIAWKQIVPEPGRGGVTTTASGLAFVGGGDGELRAYDTYTGNQLWSFQTGHQIAAGPSIYEDNGKEYLAITVGGTPTSSYGGTASQLQIFALNGSATQSIAPAIRPPGVGPGVLRAPTEYLSAGAQPHTVELQVISSQYDPSCTPTLNGYSKGGLTVNVPQGWKVYVTFVNHGAACSDGVSVVEPGSGSAPAFGGATTSSSGVAGGGVDYFQFTAGKQGDYQLRSTVPKRAAAGEWIHFDVVASSQPPELIEPGQTFAIVASGKAVGG